MSLRVHVVSHTHWDREWYQPAERFRQRLVALIDELLDAPPPPGEAFLLDGQTIVLDDYLDVRPERRPAVEALLREGRLESGPWYVLADELIPSGEAIVRNLLAGRRTMRAIGASAPPVLYCPDSFGHPAMLPAIASGFGLRLIVLWRGFGGARWPRAVDVVWRAPSGESVRVYHLSRDGYELGASLPVNPGAARARWAATRAALTDRSHSGVVLLLNGADHHARQHGHEPAIEALRVAALSSDGDLVQPSSLTAFATQLTAASGAALPIIVGELRDSYGYTWALQGTFASRAAQKRLNAGAERALVRGAEPWSALAWLAGGPSQAPLVRAAWRTLLSAHPHDTLCGCSIDEVARAAEVRFSAAASQAAGVRDDAIAALLGHDPDAAAGRQPEWRPLVVVRNPSPRVGRGVAIIDLIETIADEAVGPGSRPPVPVSDTRPVPAIEGTRAQQLLAQGRGRDRIESARHYPDNDLVRVSRIAAWVDDVPPLGLVSLPIVTGPLPDGSIPNPVQARGSSLDNGLVSVAVDGEGVLVLVDGATGRAVRGLLAIEQAPDQGDLYTPSIRGPAEMVMPDGIRLSQGGPLVGELMVSWSSKGTSVAAAVGLHAGSSVVHFGIQGENAARDCRVRLVVATDVEGGRVWADAAFGPVERRPVAVSPSDREMESPPDTAPLHRYVSLFRNDRGATVFSDGLGEYEATADGRVFITLLRCVGELSRNDLPERPGHAGWPVATPAAQSPGPFAAAIALLLHGPREAGTIDSIERTADTILNPLRGTTVRNALHRYQPTTGVILEGEGLAFSALKESESGEHLVLRCVNLLDVERAGRWRLPCAVAAAWRARLDETAVESLDVVQSTIEFVAGPREICTILVQP